MDKLTGEIEMYVSSSDIDDAQSELRLLLTTFYEK